MLFICWLFYQWAPPIVNAHIELLQRTGDTLESMDDTLQQSNAMLEQLAEGPYPSEDFRKQVSEEHLRTQKMMMDANGKIDDIHKVIVKDKE